MPNTCSNCSASIDANAPFCSSCGAPISSTGTINCPKCGKAISADARFCKYCAYDFASQKQVAYSQHIGNTHSAPLRKKSGKYTSPLIGPGGALVILSIVAFFWARNYMDAHAFSGFSGMMGSPNDMYQIASGVAYISPFTFLVGLALLIVGLSKNR